MLELGGGGVENLIKKTIFLNQTFEKMFSFSGKMLIFLTQNFEKTFTFSKQTAIFTGKFCSVVGIFNYFGSMSTYFEANKRQRQRKIGLKRIIFVAATEFCSNKVLKPF